MKRSWIKLYVELLDDDKLGPLPVWLKWRFVELLLVAAEGDGSGTLPPVARLAWRLRVPEEDLVRSLRSLSEIGVVCEQGGCWKVSNFEKRQAALTTTERVQAYRQRHKGETKSYKDDNGGEVTSSSSPSVSVEGGGLGEGDLQIPETAREAARHPDLMLFEEISDVFPGQRDYEQIIRAMQKLRTKHNGGLKAYLQPFWAAWKNGKTKDGRAYKKTNPVWLTEWAINGEIPGESALTNGPAYKPYTPPAREIQKSAPPPKPAGLRDLTKKLSNKKALAS